MQPEKTSNSSTAALAGMGNGWRQPHGPEIEHASSSAGAIKCGARHARHVQLPRMAPGFQRSSNCSFHSAFRPKGPQSCAVELGRTWPWSPERKNLRKPKCGAANEDEGPPKMRYSSWLYRSSSPPSPSTTKRAEERELGVALKAARWAFRTGMLNFVKRLGGKSATLLAECALPYALCIVNVYVNKYITVSILMVRVSSIGRASSALTLFCHTFHTKCLPVSMTRLSQCFAMARIGGFFVLSCLVL